MQHGGALTSMTETFSRERLRSALWLGIAQVSAKLAPH
jgi:hypothetical protein